MAEEFKPDDRVMDRYGLKGTVIAVNGELIDVRFDTSMRQTVPAKKLTKIASDESE